MILYRFSRKEHGGDLSGKGAELFGGRWNSKGVPVVYTAENRALAVTEMIAYAPPGFIPEGYVLNIIEAPDIETTPCEIKPEILPEGWKRYPHGKETKTLGDSLLKAKECLLIKVPSALVQGEFNYLLNPLHPDFPQVKVLEVLPFNFNERLFH
ncbi:RES family NAD+ phosphorylase [Nafulsella turpanensis]|uniref:RES family NAD+ phosphorylase n=1 Tax=Nafulsella turpanensis TaxID=1265690 RepID=UPI00034A5ABB|nr:RES family NAD+ phosphorylase [Nafulsella turpanensis]